MRKVIHSVVAGAVALACVSILSGCWWGRREPRHDDRVVVHEDRHEDHHDDHREDRRDEHHDEH